MMKEIDEGEKGYEPIPLTSELLEKCGVKDGTFWSKLVGGSIEMDLGKNEAYVGGLESCTDSQVYIVSNFKYLHQLQNLFFALTGRELQIDAQIDLAHLLHSRTIQ